MAAAAPVAVGPRAASSVGIGSAATLVIRSPCWVRVTCVTLAIVPLTAPRGTIFAAEETRLVFTVLALALLVAAVVVVRLLAERLGLGPPEGQCADASSVQEPDSAAGEDGTPPGLRSGRRDRGQVGGAGTAGTCCVMQWMPPPP